MAHDGVDGFPAPSAPPMAGAGAAAAPGPSLQLVLPAGWEARTDARTGRMFYVDHNTRTTTFETPPGAVYQSVGGVAPPAAPPAAHAAPLPAPSFDQGWGAPPPAGEPVVVPAPLDSAPAAVDGVVGSKKNKKRKKNKMTAEEKRSARGAALAGAQREQVPGPVPASILADAKAMKKLKKKMKGKEWKAFQRLPSDYHRQLFLGQFEEPFRMNKWLPLESRIAFICEFTDEQRNELMYLRRTDKVFNGKEMAEFVRLDDDQRLSYLGIRDSTNKIYHSGADIAFFVIFLLHWALIATLLGVFGPQADADDFPVASHLIFICWLFITLLIEWLWVRFFFDGGKDWLDEQGWWVLKPMVMSLLARWGSYGGLSFFIIALAAGWGGWGAGLGIAILAMFFSCFMAFGFSLPVGRGNRDARKQNLFDNEKSGRGFKESFEWLALNVTAWQLTGFEVWSAYYLDTIKGAVRRPEREEDGGPKIYAVPRPLASNLSSLNTFDNLEPILRGMFEDLPMFAVQTAFLVWQAGRSDDGWGSSAVFTLFSSIIELALSIFLCFKAFRGLDDPRWAKKPPKPGKA